MLGTCTSFCPPSEVSRRRGQQGVGEEGTPGFPLIKSYTRSAAGQVVSPEDVRPQSILCAVVEHLLSGVLLHPRVSYRDDFVGDRLRAVRADACMQRLCSPPWLHALVRQTRYHLLVSYLLHGALGEGSSAVTNGEREGEALGDAVGCALDSLTQQGGTHAASEASLLTCTFALEVLGYALITALPQAPVAQGYLAQGTAILPHAPPSAQGHWRSITAVCLAWLGGRWGEFLRLTDALCSPTASPTPHPPPAVFFARCALHRHIPTARLSLLQALNEAVPKQLPFPLTALSRLLRYHCGSKAGRGEGGGGSDAVEAEREPGWFRTSRLLVQLRMEVMEKGEGGGVSPCTAQSLLGLREEWLSGSDSATATAESLSVVFNKASPPPCCTHQGATQDTAQLRLSLILTPQREDAFLAHPGATTIAPFSPLILA